MKIAVFFLAVLLSASAHAQMLTPLIDLPSAAAPKKSFPIARAKPALKPFVMPKQPSRAPQEIRAAKPTGPMSQEQAQLLLSVFHSDNL